MTTFKPFSRLVALTLGLLVTASASRADTVWIGTLAYKDVKVKGVKGEEIIFLTAGSGNEARRPMKDVSRIQLSDEPALSAAEEAFAAKQWEKAVEGYQKTLKSSNKDWLKDWSAQRLLHAANEAKRVDAAVVAYIAVLMRDPATAVRNKPTMPQGKSAFLDTAAVEVERALKERLTDEQKQPLLSLQLEIARARGDEKSITAAAEELNKVSDAAGADGAGGGGGGAVDPAALQSMGDVKLGLANTSLDKKEYQKAIDTVEQNKHTFVDPKQQADALWILAQSRHALAAQKNDPAALRDAALAYMRIVAHFKDATGAPHVADALLHTGEILEKVKDADGALNVYDQLATQYPETPAGTKGKAAADRLKAAAAAKQG